MGDICKIWENEDRLLATHSFSNSSLTFLPLDALLIEEVQLPLSDEFFLSAIVVGGGGAAFFFRLRPRVVYDMMKGRVSPRFFHQGGHETMYASSGNNHFFTK